MVKILKRNKGVLVTLEDEIVKKTVLGLNHSRFRGNIPPEEMVDREVKALERLRPIYGIQQIIGRGSSDTFYSEYIKGNSLYHTPFKSLSKDYFDELAYLIRKCHEIGVYDLGFRRRDFIVTPENRPAIVDFGDVLFKDDTISNIPGVITAAKIYNFLGILDLKRKYVAD